jgi:FtsZ-binding cell division protein ZapB
METPGQVLYTEQLPSYSKFSLEHKSTEKIYLNNVKRQTQQDRRTLSGSFCGNCVKYQKTVEELKLKQNSLSEKFVVTEKHLKQYDHLLQIKDNRLKQQENSLKSELETFEKEKDKLNWEKQRIEEEKIEIQREKQLLLHETRRIEYEMEELHNKSKEISSLFESLEIKKAELQSLEKSFSSPEKDLKQSLIISRENDILRLMDEIQSYKSDSSPVLSDHSLDMQKCLRQKEKNKQKKIQLKNFANDLMQMKEKFENEQKQNFEEFESRMSFLSETQQKIIEEKNQLDKIKDDLSCQLEVVNKAKSFLASQQEAFEKERELWQGKLVDGMLETPKRSRTRFNINKPDCSNCKIQSTIIDELKENISDHEETLKKLQKENENLKERADVLEGKLKIIECSREEYENENEDLKQSLSSLKHKKRELKGKLEELQNILSIDDGSAKQQIEKLTNELQKYREDRNEINKENLNLSSKVQILTLKCEELEQELEKSNGSATLEHNQSVSGLLVELQVKLEKLKDKENELMLLQNQLNEERISVQSAAEFIKSINQDLAVQRQAIEEDKSNNEIQKLKIVELEKMQKDKGKMLLDKEKELNLYREKLVERENLLILKEKKPA